MIPLKNAAYESILKGLFDLKIYLFGAPKNILTAQGQNFVSELAQNIENIFRIKHIKTTVYHSQSNGAVEKTHSTIKNLLKASIEDHSTEWDQNLKIICMPYNTMKHEATGYSPFN